MPHRLKRIIPTLLTILRIVLTPVVIYLSATGHHVASVFCFGIAAFTDYLDGKLSRYWHVDGVVGAMLDAAADKFLVVTCFAYLYLYDMFNPFLLWVVILRDGLQGLCILMLRHPLQIPFEYRPIFINKLSTTIHMGIILFYFIKRVYIPAEEAVVPPFLMTLSWFAFGVCALSLIRFVHRFTLIVMGKYHAFD